MAFFGGGMVAWGIQTTAEQEKLKGVIINSMFLNFRDAHLQRIAKLPSFRQS